MRNNKPVAPAVRYFFRRLEKRSEQIQKAIHSEAYSKQEVEFDKVEGFFRQIMTQNIFIHTVGLNGKHESTILSKAIFSMNRVVRVYYSTSFDENQSGFIRVRPDSDLQAIVVERLHGYRPTPETLYVNSQQCHIIRFMVRWLIRRIDWDKTKLNNLDLYKRFLEEQQMEIEAKIAEAAAKQEEEEIKRALEKHQAVGNRRRKIHAN
ncbi:hypothetical protein THMIRHAM_03980 [Thiomicrorhabdus immobilis]|uniref:Uncharacterized protein n=1 Tax=Thiomicrorhabdus immobilis TaxID=2791037 RepID=A0ABM7MB91_9GAMM|nr:hypothetical protein [Thiomicrorhabdus immobilis]BCN92613.1 hypothetical protein THMIRHAM_03980 [Thiomicrorhabdus immobilis]